MEFSFRCKEQRTLVHKCKECSANDSKAHYRNNKEQYRNRCRKTRLKRTLINRQLIIEFLLVNPCSVCDEADIRCLEFDHIDKSTKRDSISRMLSSGLTWNVIRNEIRKCRVLCSNCHRKRTSKQLKYFKETAISSMAER